ncbi:hypothetical protein BpHYR1_008526 [Brachionus plicatilis]|uniref:Uncharacterized protein n=1 Tax=Brachionus plicatilis TaxID=10195 RepID=A0A3M7T4L5_BRAPC|nr:hypothetical protein BpHYR1_008526 [Brachionus plicatilis]
MKRGLVFLNLPNIYLALFTQAFTCAQNLPSFVMTVPFYSDFPQLNTSFLNCPCQKNEQLTKSTAESLNK